MRRRVNKKQSVISLTALMLPAMGAYIVSDKIPENNNKVNKRMVLNGT
jgi:hypothetical protein